MACSNRMAFRWAMNINSCEHDLALCNCFASCTATQGLDEVEFARSACQAAAAGHVDKLRRMLERSPDAVHSDGGKGTSGYTPLHYAARSGQLGCAALLLERGAAVDARTVAGSATPLHRAAHVGCLPVIQLLVRHGADGRLQDSDGEAPLHKAAAQGHDAAAAYLLERFPDAAALRDRHGRTPQEAAVGAAMDMDWHQGR